MIERGGSKIFDLFKTIISPMNDSIKLQMNLTETSDISILANDVHVQHIFFLIQSQKQS